MKMVVKVENLSKVFNIRHEGKESYTALRDVMAQGAKKIFNKKKEKPSVEEFWALKDVSFEIEQGDRVGIIGRNGAGKSTLLKILSRITEPTKGRITIDGRVASLLEVGTGFHPELTGRENIFLNGAILGMTRAEIKSKFDEIVDFAEVEKFLDTPVKRYSSGMYVRLAFAVAAHLEPEILIVDEVLAVGDAQFQKKCLGKMEDVSKDGRTILFVSHNMGTILQLCNKGLLLNKGKVESFGNINKIVDQYYNSTNESIATVEKSEKGIYVKSVFCCDYTGTQQQNFGHKDDIYIRVLIGVNKFTYDSNIGICLLKRDKKRVFTVNKSLEEFYQTNEKEILIQFKIDNSIIAPSDYSFLIALNTLNGNFNYDWHEDICPIKVYDDGTEFSGQEGYDYGCIIVKPNWKQIK